MAMETEVKNVPWIKVESSNIMHIGWLPTSVEHPPHVKGELFIQFASGGIYRYEDVGAFTYASLLLAESIGRYFHHHIRMSFKSERMRDG